MPNVSLHETDFYAWTQQQLTLLRSGKTDQLDYPSLIEEIEGMGASERRVLISRLAVLMGHLLKWQFQPSLRGRSWQLTIKEQRRQLERHLRDNPSLHARMAEFVPDAYMDAVLLAERETGLDEAVFPPTCPYTEQELVDTDFYPDA